MLPRCKKWGKATGIRASQTLPGQFSLVLAPLGPIPDPAARNSRKSRSSGATPSSPRTRTTGSPGAGRRGPTTSGRPAPGGADEQQLAAAPGPCGARADPGAVLQQGLRPPPESVGVLPRAGPRPAGPCVCARAFSSRPCAPRGGVRRPTISARRMRFAPGSRAPSPAGSAAAACDARAIGASRKSTAATAAPPPDATSSASAHGSPPRHAECRRARPSPACWPHQSPPEARRSP